MSDDNIALLSKQGNGAHVENRESKLSVVSFDKKAKNDTTYNPPELKECPNCHARTYSNLHECKKCGKLICDNCAFFDDLSLNNQGQIETGDIIMCETCYEETYADEIKAAPDNTTLFDTISGSLMEEDEVTIEEEGEDDSNR